VVGEFKGVWQRISRGECCGRPHFSGEACFADWPGLEFRGGWGFVISRAPVVFPRISATRAADQFLAPAVYCPFNPFLQTSFQVLAGLQTLFMLKIVTHTQGSCIFISSPEKVQQTGILTFDEQKKYGFLYL